MMSDTLGHKGKKFIGGQYFKESNGKCKRGLVKFELLETHVYILCETVFYPCMQFDEYNCLPIAEYQFLCERT